MLPILFTLSVPAAWAKLTVPEGCVNFRRWHAGVSARPSAKA